MVRLHYPEKCCWSSYCLTASPVHFLLPRKDIAIYFLMILQSGNPQLYCCIISNMQLRLDGYRAREPDSTRKPHCCWKTAAVMRLKT